MANIATIESALVYFIKDVVYPNSTANPSIINKDVTIRPGWPSSTRLDNLLRLQNANISVFNIKGMQKTESRYARCYRQIKSPIPTLVVSFSSQTRTITFSGTPTAGEKIVININGVLYVYTVLSGQSLNDIAAAVSALIPASSNYLNTISVTFAYSVRYHVGTQGLIAYETKRQKMMFNVTIHTSNVSQREILYPTIELAFSKIDYLKLQNDIDARIIWKSTDYIDDYEKESLYCCSIKYEVEFATTEVGSAQQINAFIDTINPI
jgi:hypothetical protein